MNLARIGTKNFAGAGSQTWYKLGHVDVLWDHTSICEPTSTCIGTSLVRAEMRFHSLK